MYLVHCDRDSNTSLSCNSAVLFRVLILVVCVCAVATTLALVCVSIPPYSCVYLRSFV
jgi:hypothetical protein